jgi:transposase-like protein
MNQERKPNGAKTPLVHTEEFKRSVVDHWRHSDKTAEQVAQDFGVKVWNVRNWRRRRAQAATIARPRNGQTSRLRSLQESAFVREDYTKLRSVSQGTQSDSAWPSERR